MLKILLFTLLILIIGITTTASADSFEVIPVPFDGDGPAINALLGGHVDFLPSGFTATAEHIRSGRLRALAVVNDTELALLPGVPPITDTYPEFGRFLPWGTGPGKGVQPVCFPIKKEKGVSERASGWLLPCR